MKLRKKDWLMVDLTPTRMKFEHSDSVEIGNQNHIK